MTTIEQDIDRFTAYARQRIESEGDSLTIDELFDLWRIENPPDEQIVENVAAIQASIDDFKAGDRGTVAGEHSARLRREFGANGK